MKKKLELPASILPTILTMLLAVLGTAALISGSILVFDPSGKLIGFPEGELDRSPFPNYLIPGILLTVVLGILPLWACYGLIKKKACSVCQKISPLKGMHWAWTAALTSGIGLMVWIAVQTSMIQYSFLQPLLFTWGLAISVLCLLPPVRRQNKFP